MGKVERAAGAVVEGLQAQGARHLRELLRDIVARTVDVRTDAVAERRQLPLDVESEESAGQVGIFRRGADPIRPPATGAAQVPSRSSSRAFPKPMRRMASAEASACSRNPTKDDTSGGKGFWAAGTSNMVP